METLKLLEEMVKIPSPSGCESAIREYIRGKAEPYCDSVYTDAMGNLIAHKKGGGKKLMFAAHMDELGVVVTSADDDGFLCFAPVGGLNLHDLVSQRVSFLNGTEGVIWTREDNFKEQPSYDKLYIDIGAKNRQDALERVKIGDMAVFQSGFCVRGDTVISKILDNRAGCAAMLKAMSLIENSGNDLYFVFTSQEEVGLRGAKAAAFAIEPDAAFAIDVTDTGDFPSAPKMAVKMGGGAAIKVMDRSVICDAQIREKLTDTAIAHNIPYQLEIMTDGGTDAGAIHLTRAGIRTGGISIPTRYIHSTSEMASVSDIENTAKLIYEAAVLRW